MEAGKKKSLEKTDGTIPIKKKTDDLVETAHMPERFLLEMKMVSVGTSFSHECVYFEIYH